jgi:DNA-binding CsgD family transcriptional regulator
VTRHRDAEGFVTDDEWRALEADLAMDGRLAEVLRLAFSGMTEREMARELGISHNTVHGYMKRLYRRLDAHSRPELLVCTIAGLARLRLRDPPE